MAYAPPKRDIYQEFEQAVAQGAAPLHVCCVGPLFNLHRYEEPTEKAQVGDYQDNVPSTEFAWPNSVAGGVVDLDDARIMVENTKLRYYEGSSNAELVSDNGNTLYTAVVVASNGYASRDSALGTRDVAVGDWVRAYWIDGATTHEYLTTVAAIEADTVAGSTAPVDDPFREAGFTATSTALHATELIASPAYYDTDTYNPSSYDGLADGYPQDVYTLQVLQKGLGGVGGLDGTTIKITSAGNDTIKTYVLGTDVVWSGSYYRMNLGDRGAFLDLAVAAGPPVDDVQVGDLWTVEIAQEYTEADVTADTSVFAVLGNPSYDGALDTKYILTVIQGGTLDTASPTAGDVRIHYRTNNGADVSGYITIPVADFSAPGSNDYAIGSRNVELRFFHGKQFNTGGIISFSMRAPSAGALRRITLNDSLPAERGATFGGGGPDIDVSFYVQQDLEFPATFLSLSQDAITVNGSAQVESTLLGASNLYPISGGRMYADYRELRTDLSGQIGAVSTQAERTAALGPISVKNPLGKAVHHALHDSEYANACYYVAVGSNDAAGYQIALDLLTENDDVYSIIPLTKDNTIKDSVFSHVLDRSQNNQWRIAWMSNDATRVVDVYTSLANSNDLEGTVGIYPVSSYRELTAAGALFVTNDTRPGDTVRINYAPDGLGGYTYEEYTVDRVVNESTLVLVEDLGGPISVAVKFEIWRTQNKTDYAASLAAEAARYNHRRVRCIYADNPVDADGTPIDNFYVCASLAGQLAGIPPHAPMSQLDLLGINLDPQMSFGRTDLDTISAGGVWVVVKDFHGRVFSRHQVTSIIDYTNFAEREASKTHNLDHLSRDFMTATADFFGQVNISDESLTLLSTRITNTIEQITNRTYSPKIGPQMLAATILKLERDSVLRDTVVVEIDPSLPDPLNNLPITFRVS